MLHLYLFTQGDEQMPPNADDEWFAPDNARDIWISEDESNRFEEEFQNTINEIRSMSENSLAADYQSVCYEAAKRAFGEDGKSIRKFFRCCYLVLLGTESGPRLGEFIYIYGVDSFCDFAQDRLSNPFYNHPVLTR